MRSKKFLSLLMCSALSVSMLAACGSEGEATATPTTAPTATSAPTATPVPTEAPKVEKEALPEAFAHITFDGADEGYKAIKQADVTADLTGASYSIVPASVGFAYTNGPVGQCIYLDGKSGLDLNLKPTNTDAYTISFWMNASRLSNFGPTLQIGYDMGMAADAGNNVTWMNVTQSEWGESSSKIFPIVWSRNEASDSAEGTDCWPWMYAFDNTIHGKKEWIHVTIVSQGESQASPNGTTTVGAQYYINGQLVYDSADNYKNNTYFEYTWDATLAPNIMKPGDKKFESYFGVNYWDTMFKGYVDDLYVFDKALTAGQVASLYDLGDATVQTKEPEAAAAVVEAEPTATVVDTFATNALESWGNPKTEEQGFWASFSNGYELKDGETLVFNLKNHSSGMSNWHNYVMAFANVQTKSDLAPSAANYEGYAEYQVLRADNWGWGENASDNGSLKFDSNITDYAAWLKAMKNANVEIKVTRNGGEINYAATFTGVEDPDNVYTSNTTFTISAGTEKPVFVFFTCEQSYIEMLSVSEIVVDANAAGTVGTPDQTMGFWTDWSEGTLLKEGVATTINFKNYGQYGANWLNYCVLFRTNKTQAHVDPNTSTEGKELGVIRGDAYGWGFAGYEAAGSWGADWDLFRTVMCNADVKMTLTRTGEKIALHADLTDVKGNAYTYDATITTTATAEEEVYAVLLGEKCYIEIK